MRDIEKLEQAKQWLDDRGEDPHDNPNIDRDIVAEWMVDFHEAMQANEDLGGVDTEIEDLYYIQNGYIGNAILWWGVDSKGYTTDITKAGKYTKEKAQEIIQRPQDVAWPCKYVAKTKEARKLIVDGQYLDKCYSLIGKRR